MKNVICYLVSRGWEINLYVSIHSLIQSESSVDSIKVFSVGDRIRWIEELSIPVDIKEVSNKNSNYFQHNKPYITELDAETVIYMDSDTLVINSIDPLIDDKFCLKVRPDSSYESGPYFDHERWEELLYEYKSPKGPLFNSGFMIFKENSHRKIGDIWKKTIDKERKVWEKRGEDGFRGRETTDQMSFSISVLKTIDEIEYMSPEEHAYGWKKNPNDIAPQTVVYHTGSRGGRHIKYAMALDRAGVLDFSKPLISSVTNPLFLQLQAYRFAYGLKDAFVA